MDKNEEQVVKSIEYIAEQSGLHPLDVDYNLWKSSVASEDFDAYQSLGVKFGLLKKANFSKDEVNVAKFDIVKRAKVNEASIKTLEKESYFWSKFEPLAEKVFKDKLVIKPYKKNKDKVTNRILNLVLSDLHFGADLDGEHTFLKYGKTEEARRLAKVVLETANYKQQYRENTKLIVHLLGDIIQNSLHDPRDADDLAKQVNRAIHVLEQAIGFLVQQFPEIEVWCQNGNHDRFPHHKDRKVNHKDDGLGTIIYFALSKIFKNCKNIKFVLPKTPFYVIKIFDQYLFGTHGDTVTAFGMPSNNIDVSKLRKQINEFNGGREKDEKIGLFIIGHVHCPAIVRLANGTVMCNGPLLPADEFATSIGIFKNKCGQWLFESVPGHILGDTRLLEIDENTDKDASLDAIVKPYDF